MFEFGNACLQSIETFFNFTEGRQQSFGLGRCLTSFALNASQCFRCSSKCGVIGIKSLLQFSLARTSRLLFGLSDANRFIANGQIRFRSLGIV